MQKFSDGWKFLAANQVVPSLLKRPRQSDGLMSALIDWQKFPLRDLLKILRRDLDVGEVIPRALKSDDEKFLRSDAEIFTPAQIVKQMVDTLELETLFWQERIDCKCLEITCGEAPFITTRYDAESGEFIPLNRRVGILDRKFQAIKSDKNFWAMRAVRSVYGYELQPDNLLIARANVLMSFVEFVQDFSIDELREVAEIVTKNFLLTVDNAPKFDFVIGNPPYQNDICSGDNKNFAKPIYHQFMETAFKAADKAVLITPARFLFDAGATPKEFNRKMLDDPHLKVLDYAPDARKFFKNVDIEGGVAITLHGKNQNFGAIGTFIPWEELKSIHQKVVVDNPNFTPFSEIIYPRANYRFADGSPIGTNAFDKMKNYFFDDTPADGYEYIRILGRVGNRRVYKKIRRDFVKVADNLDRWKVFVPGAFGRSNLGDEPGQIISPPVIGEPFDGSTETFTAIGSFDTRDEAENCLKFIKSKFARVLLGILKVTQHNPAEKWAKVPLQNFTSDSDIDWSGDVDGQLFSKYNLSVDEINFIESHVKEMT